MMRANFNFLCAFYGALALLLLGFFALPASRAHAEDTIILKDGRALAGKIVKEDNESVYIEQNGEQRGIARARIATILHLGAPGKNPAVPAAPAVPSRAVQAPSRPVPPAAAGSKPTQIDLRSSAALIDKIRELGSPDLKERKAAEALIASKINDYMPVMLGMLHPKFASDEYTRIGILRMLAAHPPQSEVGSRMLAYAAVYEPYPEARREACVAIRTLGDDNAIRELVRFCMQEDPAVKRAVAVALHEIDDDRLLASIIRAIPAPSVTANQGEATGLDQPRYNLPVGPGGMKMPVWLPSQQVSGVATDIDSPAAELMKLIARKDLGSMSYSWANWYREKVGGISQSERDEYRDKRSLRNRMGTPPGGSSYP